MRVRRSVIVLVLCGLVSGCGSYPGDQYPAPPLLQAKRDAQKSLLSWYHDTQERLREESLKSDAAEVKNLAKSLVRGEHGNTLSVSVSSDANTIDARYDLRAEGRAKSRWGYEQAWAYACVSAHVVVGHVPEWKQIPCPGDVRHPSAAFKVTLK